MQGHTQRHREILTAAGRPPAPCSWLPHELSNAELGRRAQPV